jgi:hypothetical protein
MSWTAVRARRSRCLTNIRVRIVSGLRFARRREIVSRLPEKIRSTATADPAQNTARKRQTLVIGNWIARRNQFVNSPGLNPRQSKSRWPGRSEVKFCCPHHLDGLAMGYRWIIWSDGMETDNSQHDSSHENEQPHLQRKKGLVVELTIDLGIQPN